MRTVSLGIVLLGLILAVAGSAELAAWNQERVTAIAKDLEKKSDAAYDAYREQPEATLGSPGAQADFDLEDQLRRIQEQTHHLAAALADGKGLDDTKHTYQNLVELVHDAEVSVRSTFTENDLLTALMAAGDSLRQIAPYYDPKANAGR